MSCVLLSGRGGLYNSRCAEHRRDRMEGFIAPPSMSSLSEIRLDETTWEWPSNRLQLSQQPREEYNFVAIKIIRRHDKGFLIGTSSKRLGMPKAETTQDKSRALAVQDCHDRAARGQRNVLPALATTRSSHRGDCLRLAIDESQIARPLIPAAYAPPIMAPIDLPAIAAGEIPISSNASRAKTRNSTCAAVSKR